MSVGLHLTLATPTALLVDENGVVSVRAEDESGSFGILPGHAEWATFLKGLAIVVVDESHVYRGVFGSHVAQVLRRLRRLLAHHGNERCVFVLSSATTISATKP